MIMSVSHAIQRDPCALASFVSTEKPEIFSGFLRFSPFELQFYRSNGIPRF